METKVIESMNKQEDEIEEAKNIKENPKVPHET
jgi:hypothetical protein